MKRFAVILTETGKPIELRINPMSLAEERKETYSLYAERCLEVMLFSKDENNKLIPESVTVVPEVSRINTLNYAS